MKKVIAGILLGSVVVLAACSQDKAESADPVEENATQNKVAEDQKSDSNEAAEADEKLSSLPGIGDTVELDGVNVTLLSAELTDERADGDETNPANVLKFEYELKNTSDEQINFKEIRVVDSTGTMLDPYPLENTTDLPAPGETVKNVSHYGFEEGPVEIYFIRTMNSVTAFKVDPDGLQ